MAQVVETTFFQHRTENDRRTQKTSFWSTLKFNGRRRAFRRISEGLNQFVDCPSLSVIALALWVTIASALDALLTLIYISNGGAEANPFMDLALSQGNLLFVVIKMSLTCIGAWALSVLQQFPVANRLLNGLALIYAALIGLHVLIYATS
jgi:hypothetical protein